MNKNKRLSLYIHIPFCVQKCAYCDFLSAPADEHTKERYVQALLAEIEKYRDSDLSKRQIYTVFLGGGTPSVLKEEQTQRIIDKITDVFDVPNGVEMSMEMNPKTVTKQKIDCYSKLGINRVSIGLQSTINAELAMLGRIHTYEDFLRTYDMVAEAGISNINVDIMAALPGQSAQSYCEGLEKVTKLSPAHISAYSLIIEEGTPFFEIYNNKRDLFPDEDTDREMYRLTSEILLAQGYHRYEISNYAKRGFECKHNICYWGRSDYLGLGVGSASLIENVRFRNPEEIKIYMDKSLSEESVGNMRMDIERLTVKEQMEEFMFLGLRMKRGVSLEIFCSQFNRTMEDVYGVQISKLKQQGLLQENKKDGGWLYLTEKGTDISNFVFEQFLL